MAEYIDREAMLEDFESCNRSNPKWTPQRVKTLIVRQPPADAVPIIRCKDCKFAHCRAASVYPVVECMRPDVGYGAVRGLDDYCSYGERGEDE